MAALASQLPAACLQLCARNAAPRPRAEAPSCSGRLPAAAHQRIFRQRNSSCRASRRSRSSLACKAELQSPSGGVADGEVKYSGMFGEWSIDDSDRTEVARYRGGLTVAAVSLILATAIGLLSPEDAAFPGRIQDVLAFTGAAGLGVSLWYIHIYVAPLKKFVQGLWAVGVGSALILAFKQDTPSVVQQVVSNPVTVWGVGPFFAAVTGVAFKEGMCYGKAEAGALFFVTPLLLLGHLTGWVPPVGQKALLVVFTALFTVFAARKYTQPIKDDLGDKSVFEFQKLPEAEQELRLEALRQQRAGE